MLNDIVEIATEVLASDKDTIRANGENWPTDYVKQRYGKLDMSSIAYVIESLKNYTGGASNIRGFIITTLFNASATLDTYVNIKVNRALAVNENNK